ncbi:MAG: UDP-N-acetylglucosamine pyrophosphorylase [Clostridia bacterium]|nr:UDP-N-acetylglucosamine pyrophosphorylase [Clostridia bacterium]
MDRIKIKNLFSLENTAAAPLLQKFEYPYEVLPHISDFIIEYAKTLDPERYDDLGDGVFAAKSATIAKSASITGPCIIGENTQVRHCAFIRGSVFVGDNCVVGNSSEVKNVIIFNNVQVPHYNYVGDSILGYRSHMGAGSITSNIKSDRTPVKIRLGDKVIETGIRKIGAFLGDYVEIGCGSVMNPGTIIGKNTIVYPLSMLRGYVPEKSIYKNQGEVVKRLDEC